MEVPEVLKWSFLICGVPAAFNGVQTGVLVGATGKSESPPRNNSNRPLFLTSNFRPPCPSGSPIFKKWHGFCGARIYRFGFSSTRNTPPPPPPRMDSECASGCTWSTARATAPSLGQPTPGVVKQDMSSGGSVDTTKTRSGPQRVRMSGGERPIGAAKGKQSDTEALCQPPPPPPPRVVQGVLFSILGSLTSTARHDALQPWTSPSRLPPPVHRALPTDPLRHQERGHL